MITIPFLNGYFIGGIPYFQTKPFAILQGSAGQKCLATMDPYLRYEQIIVMRCVQRGTDPLQSAADSWYERRKKVHVCGEVRRKSGQQFGDVSHGKPAYLSL